MRLVTARIQHSSSQSLVDGQELLFARDERPSGRPYTACRPLPLSLVICVLLFLIAALCSSRVDAGNRKPLSVRTINGVEIFESYCSPCHGLDGRGRGPVAPALRHKIPDLTQIAKRTGDEFPVDRLRAIIDGTETLTGHGSREMPVWGPVFHQIDGDQDLGAVRTDNVVRHIESLQQK